MAAKGKKKQRSKNKKGKKQAEVAAAGDGDGDNGEYDLETMERMMLQLQEEENEKEEEEEDKVDSADEDFMDGGDESLVEEIDMQGEEEEEEEEDDDDNDDGDVGNDSGDDAEEEESTSAEEVEEEEEDEETGELLAVQRNEDDDILEEGEERCSLDLRNLLATNPHQVNQRLLYQKQQETTENPTTICVSGAKIANDEYLLQKASEGCSQLLAGLWKLETEKSDAGPMAILPKYCDIVTPRELPPPKQKAETRWEKFAKERGIAPKEKRSRKVWDEATQSWAYRTGYQKASSANDPDSWPIMEVKKNDNPFEDPWQRARDAKKDRVEKNTLNRMRNAEREGQLDRGTTRRIMKAKKEAREKGRTGGNMDMNVTPAGVPLDMVKGTQRGKALTKMALLASQRSTASMGKFDKMQEGEPERRKSLSGLKKRKFESSTDKNVVKSEAKKSLKVLENVISGGGKSKERAIRRGHYAKGETGHDFEFNDGLGASTFRKKKGRAGIGKMKKITKKLAK
eukprot:CAMPEP_0203662718 /NCGR_PEP_ID=MMETSP0090-20130426/589_1 /ASSEMBLY_ACC=CAM_ASM_001088 /TAXON_ID=426623 /ORGANISM="Chaetoceros affinis, Strain CCMP159" /LENGTH=512 /DNA_ID=CAMNT_0050525547 /DNA_START=34 /DNA_END=1572 /DNA_ORIENTATION=+